MAQTLLPVTGLLVGSYLLMQESVCACGVVPPRGAYVGIADETALIVWDADSRTEHFIRRATFNTQAKDFGFLVPTPSKPELAEAHDYTFRLLEKVTAPAERTALAVIKRGNTGAASGEMAPAGAVQILETKRVGDYDAVVLQADDPGALAQWLGKHGYATNAALTDWLRPYVKNGWFLTAFKIIKGTGAQERASTSAVRMSFKTDTPFFPYREPASQRDPKNPLPRARRLRVYVLAERRVDGKLGERGTPWPGRTVWSGLMPRAEQDFLLYELRIHDRVKGQQLSLTEFEDSSVPRPGTDEVYFSTAADLSPVERPPITHYLTYTEEDPPGQRAFVGAFALGAVSAAVVLVLIGLLVRAIRRGTVGA